VREIAYSQARAELADLFDDALAHLPARITRRRAGPAVLVSLDDFRRALARFAFTPEVRFGAGAVSIWLPELAIWGRGATYDDARADLLDEIDDLLARVAAEPRLRSAPNIVERLPWIQRLLVAEDEREREALLFAQAPSPAVEEGPPASPQR
jgi:hypothetical protein